MKYSVADNGYTQLKYKYLKIVLKRVTFKKHVYTLKCVRRS